MTKPTKPTAVAGPTLDDAANPQVFSEKTFAWVNYTPEAVQYMADSNDYVEGVANTVDADATAVETARQEVSTNKAAVDTTKGQIDTIKAQIDLQEAAVVASTGLDVSAFNIGDLLQVVDDGAGQVSAYTNPGNWCVPVGGIFYRAEKPLSWEVARKAAA